MNRKNPIKSATKKATKKVAKKTYLKKKTPPKPRKFTLDEFIAVTAENHAKTEAAIRELSAANQRSREETEARIAKSREETDKALQRLTDNIDRLSSNIGSVGKDIGELMEFIVIPKIRLAMNATGKHTFNTMQTEKELKKIDELGEKKTLTEVDVLLYGDTEVMAVETKSHLMTRDVKKHIERLEILRKNETLVDITDKKLFGAVVGAIVDEGAKNYALEKGLYVVTIREEENKLNIIQPEERQEW
ncbi:MAG: hypothetical protein LBC59_01980 [Chitinispirillales bacterium]|jgi:prefoldin subunit 5|nr:hypothetical protein [Chitinispirillales bacterium]